MVFFCDAGHAYHIFLKFFLFFKVYGELESIVDKLATDSQRGSYSAKKTNGTSLPRNIENSSSLIVNNISSSNRSKCSIIFLHENHPNKTNPSSLAKQKVCVLQLRTFLLKKRQNLPSLTITIRTQRPQNLPPPKCHLQPPPRNPPLLNSMEPAPIANPLQNPKLQSQLLAKTLTMPKATISMLRSCTIYLLVSSSQMYLFCTVNN